MNHILYLASGSAGRKKLLIDAGISFQLTWHTADETKCNLNQSLSELVKELAQLKMKHIQLPQHRESDIVLVLTADTMTQNDQGAFLGKPKDQAQAIAMLTNRSPVCVGTAFCLQKRQFVNGSWKVLQEIVDYDQAYCTVELNEQDIFEYLSVVPFLTVSGALSVEGFGQQFVKKIDGNYSAVIGMPLFSLRQALKNI